MLDQVISNIEESGRRLNEIALSDNLELVIEFNMVIGQRDASRNREDLKKT